MGSATDRSAVTAISRGRAGPRHVPDDPRDAFVVDWYIPADRSSTETGHDRPTPALDPVGGGGR